MASSYGNKWGGVRGGAFDDVCRFMTSVDLEVQGDVCRFEIDRRQIRQTSSATDVCLFDILWRVFSAEKTNFDKQNLTFLQKMTILLSKIRLFFRKYKFCLSKIDVCLWNAYRLLKHTCCVFAGKQLSILLNHNFRFLFCVGFVNLLVCVCFMVAVYYSSSSIQFEFSLCKMNSTK